MTDARWAAKASALWLAWERRTGGPPPSMNALELGLAQAEFETSCGDAWPSSHNWGACDLRSLNATELAAFKAGGLKDGMWLLPGDTWSATWDASATGVLHGDSDPNHGAFQVWFAAFPDDVAGADYFLSVALRNTRTVLNDPACSPWTYASLLYLACYYGGFHPGARPCGQRTGPFNAAENSNVADYANAITVRLPAIRAGLVGWVAPSGTPTQPPPVPAPVPGKASPGAWKAVQSALNGLGMAGAPLAVDGLLGPLTRGALVAASKLP